MNGLFVLAWFTGEAIITYRSVKEQHMPPSPRQLLVASGLFIGCAIVAEYQPARAAATAFAWAVDLAVLMQVLPGSKTPAAITPDSKAAGWSGIGLAGNTVIIPDGTAASAVDASTSTSTTTGTNTSGAGAGGNTSANQQAAQQVISDNASQFNGWGSGSQWSCLQNLWNRESGWSTSATNPTSGAYGIAQSLHGTQGGQGGNEYNASDPEGLTTAQLAGANAGSAADQILWGLNYILSTYGSPCSAWAHEQSNGWY